MTIQGKIGRRGSQKTKRALGVQAALEWAFGVEKAQLELPPAMARPFAPTPRCLLSPPL